jgi:hypothetical protein
MAARLGEILLKANLITRDQLEYSVAQQKAEGGHLGTILTKLGLVNMVPAAWESSMASPISISTITRSSPPSSASSPQVLSKST